MPTSAASTASGRLLRLLSLLQARRDWPAPVLADRLGVSERTVRRDVERLRDLDYSIETTRGPYGGYRLAAGARLPPLLLDDEQALAVAIALGSAGSLGAGVDEAAERALLSILRLLPDHLARRVGSISVATPQPHGAALTDPGALLRIEGAIRDGLAVRFDYAGADGSAQPTRPREVEPHQLLLRRGLWYLLAFSTQDGDWRAYRVDKMALRASPGRRFARRPVPGGDPAGFAESRFRGAVVTGRRWPCEGAAVLSAPAAQVAPYSRDGAVEPLGEDRCRVRLGSWSWRSLAAALLLFDADIADVEPAELREAFAVLGRRAGGAAGTDFSIPGRPG